MLNIGVICDLTWNNYILAEKKLKKFDPEKYRIHCIYGKTLDFFQNICNKHSLTINRHYSDNLCYTLTNMLKICDIWLIFTNQIEYLTCSQLIIEKCNEYDIKHVIIGEFNRDNVFYSFEHDSKLSFKKIIKTLTSKTEDFCIKNFNDENYNDNFNSKQFVPIILSPNIRSRLKTTYKELNDAKNNRSIKLLYDKDEIKKEKQLKKSAKEATQLQFINNRMSYYKNLN